MSPPGGVEEKEGEEASTERRGQAASLNSTDSPLGPLSSVLTLPSNTGRRSHGGVHNTASTLVCVCACVQVVRVCPCWQDPVTANVTLPKGIRTSCGEKPSRHLSPASCLLHLPLPSSSPIPLLSLHPFLSSFPLPWTIFPPRTQVCTHTHLQTHLQTHLHTHTFPHTATHTRTHTLVFTLLCCSKRFSQNKVPARSLAGFNR